MNSETVPVQSSAYASSSISSASSSISPAITDAAAQEAKPKKTPLSQEEERKRQEKVKEAADAAVVKEKALNTLSEAEIRHRVKESNRILANLKSQKYPSEEDKKQITNTQSDKDALELILQSRASAKSSADLDVKVNAMRLTLEKKCLKKLGQFKERYQKILVLQKSQVELISLNTELSSRIDEISDPKQKKWLEEQKKWLEEKLKICDAKLTEQRKANEKLRNEMGKACSAEKNLKCPIFTTLIDLIMKGISDLNRPKSIPVSSENLQQDLGANDGQRKKIAEANDLFEKQKQQALNCCVDLRYLSEQIEIEQNAAEKADLQKQHEQIKESADKELAAFFTEIELQMIELKLSPEQFDKWFNAKIEELRLAVEERERVLDELDASLKQAGPVLPAIPSSSVEIGDLVLRPRAGIFSKLAGILSTLCRNSGATPKPQVPDHFSDIEITNFQARLRERLNVLNNRGSSAEDLETAKRKGLKALEEEFFKQPSWLQDLIKDEFHEQWITPAEFNRVMAQRLAIRKKILSEFSSQSSLSKTQKKQEVLKQQEKEIQDEFLKRASATQEKAMEEALLEPVQTSPAWLTLGLETDNTDPIDIEHLRNLYYRKKPDEPDGDLATDNNTRGENRALDPQLEQADPIVPQTTQSFSVDISGVVRVTDNWTTKIQKKLEEWGRRFSAWCHTQPKQPMPALSPLPASAFLSNKTNTTILMKLKMIGIRLATWGKSRCDHWIAYRIWERFLKQHKLQPADAWIKIVQEMGNVRLEVKGRLKQYFDENANRFITSGYYNKIISGINSKMGRGFCKAFIAALKELGLVNENPNDGRYEDKVLWIPIAQEIYQQKYQALYQDERNSLVDVLMGLEKAIQEFPDSKKIRPIVYNLIEANKGELSKQNHRFDLTDLQEKLAKEVYPISRVECERRIALWKAWGLISADVSTEKLMGVIWQLNFRSDILAKVEKGKQEIEEAAKAKRIEQIEQAKANMPVIKAFKELMKAKEQTATIRIPAFHDKNMASWLFTPSDATTSDKKTYLRLGIFLGDVQRDMHRQEIYVDKEQVGRMAHLENGPQFFQRLLEKLDLKRLPDLLESNGQYMDVRGVEERVIDCTLITAEEMHALRLLNCCFQGVVPIPQSEIQKHLNFSDNVLLVSLLGTDNEVALVGLPGHHLTVNIKTDTEYSNPIHISKYFYFMIRPIVIGDDPFPSRSLVVKATLEVDQNGDGTVSYEMADKGDQAETDI